ncbi:pre-mRNA-splicing factor cwc22 [Linnemannia gamsii]|uniref:Pre-mRNA-splicing factor cwc22 n=1 Tax=Linnemannia gamsii TaxID=64522 RepID=A0A9P6RGT5_9FUNG|nr:pre-mRNA-splicing factor cwc22 [Linnemannia gamsii]
MLLVFLCPPIEPQDHADSDDIEQTDSALDEEAEKSDKQFAFLSCFMRYINSGKWPPLAAELKKMYKNSMLELQEQIKAEREWKHRSNLNEDSSSKPSQTDRSSEGVVKQQSNELARQTTGSTQLGSAQKDTDSSVDSDLEINRKRSAFENFLKLNKLTRCPRRYDGLATFSEKELLVLFWGQPLLASKVWELAKDELEIQFIAYKLKELQSAGFKRVPDDWLPQNRLISTVAGVNYFLTEIRKVVRTKVDVMRLWPQDDCGPDKLKTQKDIERLWSEGTYDPEKIKVECIDLGQAFVMGSPALLSDALGFDKKGKMMQALRHIISTTPFSTTSTFNAPSSTTSTSTAPSSTKPSSTAPPSTAPPSTEATSSPSRPVFYNLVVKQKAVYRPTFKHRRWIKYQWPSFPPGLDDSITDIESRLPPLRGSDASVVDYLQDLERVQERLNDFYNDDKMTFKRHRWDARRAREEDGSELSDSDGGDSIKSRAQVSEPGASSSRGSKRRKPVEEVKADADTTTIPGSKRRKLVEEVKGSTDTALVRHQERRKLMEEPECSSTPVRSNKRRDRSFQGTLDKSRKDDSRDRRRDHSGDRHRDRSNEGSRGRGPPPPRGIYDVNQERRRERERQMEERAPAAPRPRQDPVEEMRTMTLTRTGGAYIPPARLRMMQEQITDKSSKEYQRIAWEALKKSINGLINKVTAANIKAIIPELFGENLVRGRGLFCKSIMKAQAASMPFTPVYAAVVAVVNTKLPQIGELLITRLIVQFRKAYKRNDKATCLATTTFIAHLTNQWVAHEILALKVLFLLLGQPTEDSIEIAVGFMKEVGSFLSQEASGANEGVFERLRNILHEGKIEKRTQYMIEVLFQIRKDKYKDNPPIGNDLDLVDDDEQITHTLELDEEDLDVMEGLNVFKFDPEYLENEEKYGAIKAEILGEDDDSDESGSDESDEDEEDGEESREALQKKMEIQDRTNTNLVNLRKTIYLTIKSSLNFEECCHKLMLIKLEQGQQIELCNMVIECCSQERTYEKFYGLVGERFSKINRDWSEAFKECFATNYETIHRLETNPLRNVAKYFGHLMSTDALPWDVLSVIHLNEEETTSSSRIFIKILFQDLVESLGLKKLNERVKDPYCAEWFSGLFPKDNPKSTRFAINFFTSIGLGALTTDLREHLKNAPKSIMAQQQDVESSDSDSDSDSDSSSSGSDSDSDTDSSSGSDSSSSSSDSEDDRRRRRSSRRRRTRSRS